MWFKIYETYSKVDETKSTTKHPISEELIVAITCFNFFKLVIDIAEKIISSIIKKQINTDSIEDENKTTYSALRTQPPSPSPSPGKEKNSSKLTKDPLKNLIQI